MVHVHTWTLYNFSERGTSLIARFRFHVSSVIGDGPQNSLSLLRAMDSALAEPPRSAAESVLGPALGHVQTMLCHCRLDARQTRGSVSPSPTMHHARSWPSHKRTKNELIMNHFASRGCCPSPPPNLAFPATTTTTTTTIPSLSPRLDLGEPPELWLPTTEIVFLRSPALGYLQNWTLICRSLFP